MPSDTPRWTRRGLLTGALLGASGVGAARWSSAAAAVAADAVPLARRLADYIVGIRLRDLPPAAIERAKEELLYHVGLAFTGAKTPAGRQALEIARTLSRGCPGPSTIIGAHGRYGALEAAFANASFIRALGLDDVLFPSATHAGLLTYPAALAIAEQQHSRGDELLIAVVAAYEILGKLVIDEAPGRAPHRPSMPFGPFAGATATARLLRLPASRTAEAIGYAADSAMGLKEGNEQQPTHIYGLIARHAIMAAMLARAGGETAPTILEGKYGFYATLIGRQPNADDIVRRLGKDLEILRVTQKRFSGTAMNVVPIELMLDLVNREHLAAREVSRIEFELPEDRSTFEDSISTGPYPSRTQAESSLPFQTAIILLDGHIDLARYDHPNDPQVLAVTHRVIIRLRPHANTRFAHVVVTTQDGRRFERQGDSYAFPPLDALAWVERDGDSFVPRANLERFVAGVHRLEQLEDVSPLLQLLSAGP